MGDILKEVEQQTYDLSIEDLELIYSTIDLTSLNNTDSEESIENWLTK